MIPIISLWWSFALTAFGVAGLFLVYRSTSLVGPIVGVLVQALWIAYALATGQLWFLVSAFAYAGTNLYGIQKRRKAEK